MSPNSEKREPFFFGDERRLYGCLHHAVAGRRQTAVLIAQPIAHEYMRSHRSLMLLASRLVRADFPVLRFDYRSTGDSVGESEQARWSAWSEDLTAAVAELRRRSRLRQVAVIGMRLGATLAALHGATENDLDALVLWDPIVHGGAFRQAIAASHAAMLAHEYVDPKRVVQAPGQFEFHGHLWSEALLDELAEVDLTRVSRPARRVLTLTERPAAEVDDLADGWGAVDRQVVEGPQIWSEEPFRGLVPQAQVEAVLDWLGQVTT